MAGHSQRVTLTGMASTPLKLSGQVDFVAGQSCKGNKKCDFLISVCMLSNIRYNQQVN